MQDETQNQNSNLDDKIEDELEDLAEHSHHLPPSQDKDTDHIPDIWEKPDEPKFPIKSIPGKEPALDKKLPSTDKRGWEPINLSKGRFKHRELYKMSKANFEYNVRKDLKSVLPKFADRNEVAKRISSIRSKDITKKEVKRELKNLKQEGKLKPFQIKKLRRKFGAF